MFLNCINNSFTKTLWGEAFRPPTSGVGKSPLISAAFLKLLLLISPPSQSPDHESGSRHLHGPRPHPWTACYTAVSGVRSAGELLIARPHCWTHVLVSCTIQLDLVGAKSLISCAALKRPKPLLTVKLARLPPVFLIIARAQTKSLWRAGLKPCDFF